MYYPAGKIRYAKPDPTQMCGDGRIEDLDHAPRPPHLRAAYVKFVNGAHTKWHYHSGEQLLLATEGKGFVEFQGSPILEIHEGDRVFIPTGVWHRHGAVEGGTVVHLAVTCGKTEWDRKDTCDKHPDWKDRRARC